MTFSDKPECKCTRDAWGARVLAPNCPRHPSTPNDSVTFNGFAKPTIRDAVQGVRAWAESTHRTAIHYGIEHLISGADAVLRTDRDRPGQAFDMGAELADFLPDADPATAPPSSGPLPSADQRIRELALASLACHSAAAQLDNARQQCKAGKLGMTAEEIAEADRLYLELRGAATENHVTPANASRWALLLPSETLDAIATRAALGSGPLTFSVNPATPLGSRIRKS